MFNIKTYNKISEDGLSILKDASFSISENESTPDAIILRSQKLHDEPIADTVKAIGRAGAGTNNIPVEACTEKAIVVFNTPGANANAVKELVVAGLLLAGRDIIGGVEYTNSISDQGDDIPQLVEKNKSRFKGIEIKNKQFSVIGLGAIGVMVANAGADLGMKVKGHDPFISVGHAWGLSRNVKPASSLNQVLSESDFISLHVPLTEKTKGFMNKEQFDRLRSNTVLLNFSRPEIVEEEAILEALESGKLRLYVTDFPTKNFVNHPKVLCIPHLGASTAEAENNCAIMIANQIKDYLENGNIVNSVNFPNCTLEKSGEGRLVIINKNIPNMVGQISTIIAEESLNITEMVNKSRNDIAYTIVDLSQRPSEGIIEKLKSIDGIISVRLI